MLGKLYQSASIVASVILLAFLLKLLNSPEKGALTAAKLRSQLDASLEPRDVLLNAVPLEDGSAWNMGAILETNQSLVFTPPLPASAGSISLQADCNDDYAVNVTFADGARARYLAPAIDCHGLGTRSVRFGSRFSRTNMPVSSVEIFPLSGDGSYSVSWIALRDSSHMITQLIRRALIYLLIAALAAIALRTLYTLLLSLGGKEPEKIGNTVSVPTEPNWLMRPGLLIISLAIFGFITLYIHINLYNREIWHCSPAWFMPMLLGIGALVIAALLLDRPPKTRASIHLHPLYGSIAILIFALLIFRILPYFLNYFPQGLLFEEHEAASAGRAAMYGKCGGLILYTFNELGIGLFFQLFGRSEAALRAYGITLGTLSSLFFVLTVYTLFPRAISLMSSLLMITSLSMANAALIAEESFSIVVFILCGITFAFVWTIRTREFLPSLLLGIFLGLAAMEYAALKPALLIVPAALSICILASGPNPNANLRSRFLALGRIALVALCAFQLVASPIIHDALRGGSAFFEGPRKDYMIGAELLEDLRRKLPLFPGSLEGHARLLFIADATMPPLQSITGTAAGLLSPIDCALLLLASLWILVKALALRKRAGQADVIHLIRFSFWFSWALFLLVYCAYFNPDAVMSRRLLAVVPLLYLATAEGLSSIYKSYSYKPRACAISIGAVSLIALFWNAASLLATMKSPQVAYHYRSRTSNFCPALAALRTSSPVLYIWDWKDELYFGDTPIEEWVKAPSKRGYDSWPCDEHLTIDALGQWDQGMVQEFRARIAQNSAGFLAISTRAAYEELQLKDLQARLIRRLHTRSALLGIDLDQSCSLVFDSIWYATAICRISVQDPALNDL